MPLKAAEKKLAKAAKIGAVLALTGLAVYGAHKAGYLDKARAVGEAALRKVISKVGGMPIGDVAGSFKPPSAPQSQPTLKPKSRPVIRDPKTGFKIIHESLSDSLKNANPLKGTKEGANNCTYCSIAGILRTFGYDVTAKSTGGKMQNLGGVVEYCFKDAKVYDGTAIAFAQSPEKGAQILKKKFGDNASGVVDIDWKNGGGHAFSWIIENGKVRFVDFQSGQDDDFIRQRYWSMIDPNGSFQFACLSKDGKKLEINLDAIDKYVDGR